MSRPTGAFDLRRYSKDVTALALSLSGRQVGANLIDDDERDPNMIPRQLILPIVLLVYVCLAAAEDKSADKSGEEKQEQKVKFVPIALARGAIELKVPDHWKPKELRSPIIEKEFTVPAAKGAKAGGRLTMMRAGGSIQQNIDRWYGQFQQPDKKATKDIAKVHKLEVNGQPCVIVDITGTFGERVGTGPPITRKLVQREDYRMLGGIVQTKAKDKAQYFFKLTGPNKTVAAAEKHFRQMMESVNAK